MEQSIQGGEDSNRGGGAVIAPPLAIEAIIQKTTHDCGVAALAMYLGLPYRTVCETAQKLVPTVLDEGMTRTEAVAIGKGLGVSLSRSRKVDLDRAHGLLFVERGRSYHFVVLFRGVIINPGDGLIWDPDAYWAKTKYKPSTLLYLAD